jgi:hypothetical protein
MTIGQLIRELLQLLEIGTCKVSAKQRAISIQPYFPGELELSPTKRLQLLSIQRAYTKLARSGFSWDVTITLDNEPLLGEVIRLQLLTFTQFSPDDIATAETELIDALQGHLRLDARRDALHP